MKLILLASVVALSGLVGCAPEQLVTGTGQTVTASQSLIDRAEIELQSATPSIDSLSEILAGLEQQRLELEYAGQAVPEALENEIKLVADMVALLQPPTANPDL